MSMLASDIKRKALQLGYLGCGIIPANTFDEYPRYLGERVQTFPESKGLYEPLYRLASQPEAAKSVIVCTRRYNMYRMPESLRGMIGKLYVFDSRVAFSHEYRAKIEFETYLQTFGIQVLQGGIPARWAAVKAGIGKFGRNNFIYSPEHGSFVWIDAWAVDQALEYDAIEAADALLPACNDKCLKCVEACPTKALSGGFSMDMGRCVARLSFYSKEPPDEETMAQMGEWVYGCDACQDACPMNKDKFVESEEFPLSAEYEEYLQPERILDMDEATYENILNPRFWYSGKDSLWLWKCNALRYMINSGDAKYRHLIERCCDHEDARIRKVAQWGRKRLK
jgi:epoxyqueuosine reductase